MQPESEAVRSVEEDLEDLDEAGRAIERSEKRIEAQQQRIAQLKRDGVDSEPAEHILVKMRASLKELIMHRALVALTMAQRSAEQTRPDLISAKIASGSSEDGVSKAPQSYEDQEVES